MEGDKPFVETDVTEAILKGNIKKTTRPIRRTLRKTW